MICQWRKLRERNLKKLRKMKIKLLRKERISLRKIMTTQKLWKELTSPLIFHRDFSNLMKLKLRNKRLLKMIRNQFKLRKSLERSEKWRIKGQVTLLKKKILKTMRLRKLKRKAKRKIHLLKFRTSLEKQQRSLGKMQKRSLNAFSRSLATMEIQSFIWPKTT